MIRAILDDLVIVIGDAAILLVTFFELLMTMLLVTNSNDCSRWLLFLETQFANNFIFPENESQHQVGQHK